MSPQASHVLGQVPILTTAWRGAAPMTTPQWVTVGAPFPVAGPSTNHPRRAQFSYTPQGQLIAPADMAYEFPLVVGTKVITRRLAVSLPLCVATAKRDVQHADVPLSRAALSNKDVLALVLRATLIAAAIALLSFGGAGPKMNAAI